MVHPSYFGRFMNNSIPLELFYIRDKILNLFESINRFNFGYGLQTLGRQN